MSRDALTAASRIVGLIVLLASLLGAGYAGTRIIWRDLFGFETQSNHDADIGRVERKLDCALFDLPRNCRERLSPRSP